MLHEYGQPVADTNRLDRIHTLVEEFPPDRIALLDQQYATARDAVGQIVTWPCLNCLAAGGTPPQLAGLLAVAALRIARTNRRILDIVTQVAAPAVFAGEISNAVSWPAP